MASLCRPRGVEARTPRTISHTRSVITPKLDSTHGLVPNTRVRTPLDINRTPGLELRTDIKVSRVLDTILLGLPGLKLKVNLPSRGVQALTPNLRAVTSRGVEPLLQTQPLPASPALILGRLMPLSRPPEYHPLHGPLHPQAKANPALTLGTRTLRANLAGVLQVPQIKAKQVINTHLGLQLNRGLLN